MTRKDKPDEYDLIWAEAFDYGWNRAMVTHGGSMLDEIEFALATVEEPSCLGDEGGLAAMRSIEKAARERWLRTISTMPAFILRKVKVDLESMIDMWMKLVETEVAHRDHWAAVEDFGWAGLWVERLTDTIREHRAEVSRLGRRLDAIDAAIKAQRTWFA